MGDPAEESIDAYTIQYAYQLVECFGIDPIVCSITLLEHLRAQQSSGVGNWPVEVVAQWVTIDPEYTSTGCMIVLFLLL